MTQEEKQLLLQDLCARLPYDCNVTIAEGGIDGLQWHNVTLNSYLLYQIEEEDGLEYIKPYLRPMSSMTEEEREEWADLFNLELDKLNEIDDENEAEELAPYYFGKSHQVSIDWLNEHYFDYRGLIELGLALEAPKGMYEIQN